MKKAFLSITIILSLTLLPSTVNAAFCTDNWEANQAEISTVFFNDYSAWGAVAICAPLIHQIIHKDIPSFR